MVLGERSASIAQAGHKAVALDLPGHGDDQTPPSAVQMKDYTDRVRRAVENEPGKVILVGHSFGGMVITQAAEY